ncbi:MAG TPA: S53 family peptidase [Planctomycetaceae bacterium]|nr:S53 family peptidase [Planctomycetaceae bacterium]
MAALVAVEHLEELQLLSATSPLNALAMPLLTAVNAGKATPSTGTMSPLVTNTSPVGFTPAQIAQAYGFNQVSFSNGAVKGTGAGQTIAIVDAFLDPNIASDLQAFDSQFGVAAPPSFTQVVQPGATVDSGWAMEAALDVEWAHAMAPSANIVLVEASDSSLGSLLSGVDYARNLPNVSVVSMSWGGAEFAQETQFDSLFTTPAGHIGVTFLASSGDSGAGTSWPAVSPNVIAVGGTSLATTANGSYVAETAWSGSGGGISTFESQPSYQGSVQNTGHRTNPDVAYDANPGTGFAVYNSVLDDSGQNGWFDVGGTSAGAPQWASLIAITNQGRTIQGQGTLSNAPSMIYTLPASDFHDITSGSNGISATSGYDLVTGRGSPVVNSVVQGLGGGSTSSSTGHWIFIVSRPTSNAGANSQTNPATPTAPGSPSTPTTLAGSRGVLSAALLTQPDVSPVALNGGFQVDAVPGSPGTYLAPLTDRLVPLANSFINGTVLPATDTTSGITSVAVPSLSSSSLATNFGESRIGSASPLPELSVGLSQFALAEVSGEDTVAEAIGTVRGDEFAQAIGSLSAGFVENGMTNAIAPSAIDALFATNGWLVQATTSVESATSSSDLSKTAVVGVAASVGLVGLFVALRRRRNNAAQ